MGVGAKSGATPTKLAFRGPGRCSSVTPAGRVAPSRILPPEGIAACGVSRIRPSSKTGRAAEEGATGSCRIRNVTPPHTCTDYAALPMRPRLGPPPRWSNIPPESSYRAPSTPTSNHRSHRHTSTRSATPGSARPTASALHAASGAPAPPSCSRRLPPTAAYVQTRTPVHVTVVLPDVHSTVGLATGRPGPVNDCKRSGPRPPFVSLFGAND